MTDKRQRQLLRMMSTVGALVISQPITDYVSERTLDRQGTKDDLLKAAFQGLVWAISIFIASLVVSRVSGRSQ